MAHQRTAADRLLNSNEAYAEAHGPLEHSAPVDVGDDFVRRFGAGFGLQFRLGE